MDHLKNESLINTIQCDNAKFPFAVFLLGSNGSGKSTLRNYLNLSNVQTNIDPDVLNRINKPQYPEYYLVESAKQALHMYETALNQRFNLCIESTLAGHGTMQRIIQAKEKGYFTMAYFVGLTHVELNLERIRQRVLAGGHAIPAQMVKKRYFESMQNLIQISSYFDALYVLDNSIDFYRLQFSSIQKKLFKKTEQLENWAQQLYTHLT